MAGFDEDAEMTRLKTELAKPVEVVVTPTPTPAPEAVVDTPAVEQTPEEIEAARVAAEAAPPAPEDEEFFRGRLRGKDAAFAHFIKEGVTPAEAYSRAYGEFIAPEDPPVPEVPNPVVTLETELTTIRETLDQAAADNSLLTPELRAAQRRELELTLQIRDEKAAQKATADQTQAAQVQTEQQKFNAGWQAGEQWANQTYPAFADPKSELYAKVIEKMEAIANDENHPLHQRPEAVKFTVAETAAELGIAPKGKVIPPAAVTPPPPQRFLPAPGGKGNAAQVQQNPDTELVTRQAQAVKSGDVDEEYAVMVQKLTGKPAPKNGFALRFGR